MRNLHHFHRTAAFTAEEELFEWQIEEIPVENVLVIHDDRHLSKVLPMHFSKIGIQAFYSDKDMANAKQFKIRWDCTRRQIRANFAHSIR